MPLGLESEAWTVTSSLTQEHDTESLTRVRS